MIENSLARVITRTLKYLHWLPPSEDIQCKICLIVHKVLHSTIIKSVDLLIPCSHFIRQNRPNARNQRTRAVYAPGLCCVLVRSSSPVQGIGIRCPVLFVHPGFSNGWRFLRYDLKSPLIDALMTMAVKKKKRDKPHLKAVRLRQQERTSWLKWRPKLDSNDINPRLDILWLIITVRVQRSLS